MADGIDREELRRLVRDVLRSSLSPQPAGRREQSSNLLDAMRQAVLPGGSGVVAIGDDLDHFAIAIVHASSHEDLKAAIMSGRLKFRSNSSAKASAGRTDAPAQGGLFRMDQGMLTETRLAEIGKSHTKIILGPEVVVTPLARDRARELKLELVRSKP